jgi:hypothetical protein
VSGPERIDLDLDEGPVRPLRAMTENPNRGRKKLGRRRVTRMVMPPGGMAAWMPETLVEEVGWRKAGRVRNPYLRLSDAVAACDKHARRRAARGGGMRPYRVVDLRTGEVGWEREEWSF